MKISKLVCASSVAYELSSEICALMKISLLRGRRVSDYRLEWKMIRERGTEKEIRKLSISDAESARNYV